MLGRATLLLMISQGFFLVSGYTVNVGLARLLGPADFGTFGVVMSFLLVIQLFVITGIPIALQKFVAENMDASLTLHRRVLPRHLAYSVLVFAFFWCTAPLFSKLLRDGRLTFYLQIASIDIIFYGLYKYYLSMQNGLHDFGKQTISGIAYAVSKPLTIFVLVGLGYGITGAIIGNTLGSVGGFLVGILLTRFPEVKAKLEDIPFFRFAFTNVFYFVGLQLLFAIDIWFVKYHLSETVVGEYVSASSVAKIPYFLSLAVSSALLPSVARASKANDENRVQEIVRVILRYWLMLLLAMIVVVGATSDSLIVLFFGSSYQQAGPILAVLFAAIALLTFAAVMNTILISRGRLLPCLSVIGFLLVLDIVANAVLVPVFSGLGAAYATLIAAASAVLLSAILLLRETGAMIPTLSAFRAVVAAALVFLGTMFLPLSQNLVWLIAKCLALPTVFVGLLFLMRELNFADIKRLQAIMIPNN